MFRLIIKLQDAVKSAMLYETIQIGVDRRVLVHDQLVCVFPPLDPKGGATLACGGGGGGLNSDDWTESLALCILCGSTILLDGLLKLDSTVGFFGLG